MVSLNLERINLTVPYQLRPTPKELECQFTTDFGVIYTIGFVPDEILTCTEVYQFNLINTNNRTSPRDPKVRDTVLTFIYDFFQTREAAMLYICETGDNKQRMRQRLFRRWIETSPYKNNVFDLFTRIVDAEGTEHYASLLYRVDHPAAGALAAEFAQTAQILNEKPE